MVRICLYIGIAGAVAGGIFGFIIGWKFIIKDK